MEKRNGKKRIIKPITDKMKIAEMKSYLRKKSMRDYFLFTLGINCGLRISDLLKLKVSNVAGKTGIDMEEKKTGKRKIIAFSPELMNEIEKYIEDAELTPREFLFSSRNKFKDVREYSRHVAKSTMSIADDELDKITAADVHRGFLEIDDDKIFFSSEAIEALKELIEVVGNSAAPLFGIEMEWPAFDLNKPLSDDMALIILRDAGKACGLPDVGTHTLRKTYGYWMYIQSDKNIALVMKLLNHSDQAKTLRYLGLEQEHMEKVQRGFYL